MTEAPVQSILTPLNNTVASIIAIMNNKGGAGKTSTITNLAMTLARYDETVFRAGWRTDVFQNPEEGDSFLSLYPRSK